jgi:hypothetical protein
VGIRKADLMRREGKRLTNEKKFASREALRWLDLLGQPRLDCKGKEADEPIPPIERSCRRPSHFRCCRYEGRHWDQWWMTTSRSSRSWWVRKVSCRGWEGEAQRRRDERQEESNERHQDEVVEVVGEAGDILKDRSVGSSESGGETRRKDEEGNEEEGEYRQKGQRGLL